MAIDLLDFLSFILFWLVLLNYFPKIVSMLTVLCQQKRAVNLKGLGQTPSSIIYQIFYSRKATNTLKLFPNL